MSTPACADLQPGLYRLRLWTPTRDLKLNAEVRSAGPLRFRKPNNRANPSIAGVARPDPLNRATKRNAKPGHEEPASGTNVCLDG
jgi:hypothetical protein